MASLGANELGSSSKKRSALQISSALCQELVPGSAVSTSAVLSDEQEPPASKKMKIAAATAKGALANESDDAHAVNDVDPAVASARAVPSVFHTPVAANARNSRPDEYLSSTSSEEVLRSTHTLKTVPGQSQQQTILYVDTCLIGVCFFRLLTFVCHSTQQPRLESWSWRQKSYRRKL
jgi:hypothetical protein